jgi:hypothetical protein
MNTKNRLKGASFTYAFERIRESINAGFSLEAVTLAESIISDRLLSYVQHHESLPENQDKLPKKHKPATEKTGLHDLIQRIKKMNEHPISIKDEKDLLEAIDKWRVERNKCVHAAAKSQPGTPTLPLDQFLTQSEKSANRGSDLARLVCDWDKKNRKQIGTGI